MSWQLTADRPIYLQLIEEIELRIVSGMYTVGEKLPGVRDLAAQASVNPNTMQKALTELERQGLVYSQRTAGLAAELTHHRQVALIGADHHTAAEEVEDRALGRLRMLSHDQAGKAVCRDRFIICLAVGGRKNAAMPVLLFNFLSQCILRQGECLFRAGELVCAA